MDVSVIIVNYHTSELVTDCLRSLYAQCRGVELEVIVVDNASEPGLQRKFDALFTGLGVKCLQLDENVGFGRANNAGAETATGRNLFFLNPDTILVNDAVSILSGYLDSHPDTGAVGGNLYDQEMNPMLSFRRRYPGIRWELNELLHNWPDRLRYGDNRRFNHTGQPMQVAYITGADLMMPASLFHGIGGFSPDFFMYYEETDLCRRISRAGYRIMSIPEARIQHLEGGSFSPDPEAIQARRQRAEHGRDTYYRRNVPPLRRHTANLLYRLFILSRKLLKRR